MMLTTLLAVCTWASATAVAAPPTPIVTGPGAAVGGEHGWRPVPERLTVAAAGADAMRMTVDGPVGDAPWSIAMHRPVTAPIAAGDVVVVEFEGRSVGAPLQSNLHIELNEAPHTKFLSRGVRFTPEWKRHRFVARFVAPQPAGRLQLAWHLGFGLGAAEVRGFQARNYGPANLADHPEQIDWFGGLPNPSGWRAAAEARIERHRKGDLQVRVVDAEGRPVPQARVRVEQLRHHFRFGTAVPAARLVGETEDDQKFRMNVLRLFNTVTFENDLKWPNDTAERREMVSRALKWLDEHQIAARGHVMVWGSPRNLPRGLMDRTDQEIVEALEERVNDAGGHYRGRLYLWDVVNEAVTERELWDRIGWNRMADVYRWARAADPGVQLAYNDFNITEEAQVGPRHRERAFEIVRNLIEAGAPLDVVGVQAHVGVPITPMSRVVELLAETARLGKPIEVTEYDLGGVPDERIYAQHLADFLTATFAEPAAQAFIMWGFWEGAHWRANEGAPIIRRDWSETEMLRAYENLVKGKWWTNVQVPAAADGGARVRAFYGRLRVYGNDGRRSGVAEVDLKPGAAGGTTVTVTIR